MFSITVMSEKIFSRQERQGRADWRCRWAPCRRFEARGHYISAAFGAGGGWSEGIAGSSASALTLGLGGSAPALTLGLWRGSDSGVTGKTEAKLDSRSLR